MQKSNAGEPLERLRLWPRCEWGHDDWTAPSGSVTASDNIDDRMTVITMPSFSETHKYAPGSLRVKKSQSGT